MWLLTHFLHHIMAANKTRKLARLLFCWFLGKSCLKSYKNVIRYREQLVSNNEFLWCGGNKTLILHIPSRINISLHCKIGSGEFT